MKQILLLIVLTFLSANVTAEDILVVVSKGNATESLSKSQVIDIFLGRYVAFPDGEPAEPVDIANEELKGEFYQRLTNLNLARVNAYWSRIKFSGKATKPMELENESSAVQFVTTEELAISYIKASSLTSNLKVVYTVSE